VPSPEVGAATVPINPPLGSSIPGYFEERLATGVHDDLLARAVYIAAEPPVAVLALDNIGIGRETVQAIRAAAERELGLPGERLLVATTHTHTGGPSRDKDYLASLVERGVEALRAAQANCRPAAVGVGSVEVPGLAFNRRYWMQDGSVRTNPGVRNPEVARPAGPVDETMHLLAFRPESGPPILVVNFPLHQDTVGGTELSADFSVYMTTKLQEELGPDTVVVFLNGACGDINHIDVLHGEPPQEHSRELFMFTTRTAEVTQNIGRSLAEAALQLLPGMAFAEDWEVAETHALLTVPLQQPDPEQVARARKLLETKRPEDLHEADEIYDYRALRQSESGKTELEMEIQALRIGPAALVTIPAEVFTEIAQDIRAQAPRPETLVVELANGCEGYMPTARAFTEGGYEVRGNKMRPDTGQAVVAQAAELLRKLG
jgi:neutral ceramidase